jgi:23S rRNA (cytosine1962-C5)-methyltransferase
MSHALPAVHLRPKAHTRLARGHRWIFSNEIGRTEGEPAPGADVRVLDGAGKTRGTGTYNPHTLIAVRLHSRRVEPLDEGLIGRRVERAVERRRILCPDRSCWRAVFSEADGLPGLIVDRLGDVAVVQILTLAMDHRRPAIVKAIEEALAPGAILEKSDSPLRELESLSPRFEVLRGEVGETIRVEEPPGIPLEVPLAAGQKTGLFLDHHENRLLLRGRVEGKRVLDVFCYIGQWSCCAAAWGAASVLGIDASGDAIARARTNAALGGVGERCRFLQGDAFDELRALERAKTPFDVIILDPPAFAKSRRQVRDALRGYKEINVRAMRLLARGGLLATACCSHHVGESDFREMLIKAARNAGREFVVEAPLRQSSDHPVLLGHPETTYIKGALLRRVQ